MRKEWFNVDNIAHYLSRDSACFVTVKLWNCLWLIIFKHPNGVLPQERDLKNIRDIQYQAIKKYVISPCQKQMPKSLTLMLLVTNLANTKLWKINLKNDWNPGTWVLIWEYSVRAIKWIPTWQPCQDGFQNLLHLWALEESSLSIGRVHTGRKGT